MDYMLSDDNRTKPLPFNLLQKCPTFEECEPFWNISSFEDTKLYELISLQTKAGMNQAYVTIQEMRAFEFKKRSKVDKSTYLHHLINQVPVIFKKYGTVNDVIPLIYQLAFKGVVVNAQNIHGNTCLHLACFRPNASVLGEHLLRIGIDPCIPNNHGVRIVHTIYNNVFVAVKKETDVRSGLWFAVQSENLEMVERLLNNWCRVNVQRNKSISDLAEETGNDKLVNLLKKYRNTNELVCAAFACDVPLVKAIMEEGQVDLKTTNSSYSPSRPLIVCLEELGYWSFEVVKLLLECGATTPQEFQEETEKHERMFEESELYKLYEIDTIDSYEEANELILQKKVNLNLISYEKERKGWTYLHLFADRMWRLFHKERSKYRLVTRMIYRLALGGIDINAKAHDGTTALHVVAIGRQPTAINHFLRLGADSSISNTKGETLTVEKYYKREECVMKPKCKPKNLPGLHAAVMRNDPKDALRWLKAGARVKFKKGDRYLIDISKSLGQTEIVKLLEEYLHLNEFLCGVFASDYDYCMNIIALGDAEKKVNIIDYYYPTSNIVNYRSEHIKRPIVVSAITLGTPQILDFLLKFGADLSPQYEEAPPCGPLAFWAFQNSINNESTLIVAKHADVTFRDELGCTMLHRIVAKDMALGKVEIVKVLLLRNINISARDVDGYTARDYTYLYSDFEKASEIRQILDDYVLDLVKLDNLIEVEQLVVNAYDHITDIRDSTKNKTALEIAESKQYYNMQSFLKKIDSYNNEIKLLQMAVIKGDMGSVARHAMEKKCAQGITIGGKTVLHLAVLFEKLEITNFLIDYFPNLVNRNDNINRSVLHYCVCLEDRLTFWPPLQDAGLEPSLVDANNLSVYDYVKQLKNPIPTHAKPKSRQWRDYKPTFEFVETERKLVLERLERTEPLIKLADKVVETSDDNEILRKSSKSLHHMSMFRATSFKEDTEQDELEKSSSSDDD